MFKVVRAATFSPALSREQARAHWTDVQGALALKLSGLTGYVQNHFVATIGRDGIETGPPNFDGYSCEWWPSETEFCLAMQSPEWQAAVMDRAEVFDISALAGMNAVVEQRVMKDGPNSSFKVVWFCRFASGLSWEQASDHWRNVHAGIALAAPGIDRYVQNVVTHAIGVTPTDEPTKTKFDGFSECWFEDQEAYERWTSTPQFRDLLEDGATLFETDSLGQSSGVLEERILLREHES